MNTEKLLYPLRPPTRRRVDGKQMLVLCLGLSQSGTDSLRSALMILGYSDLYHGFVITGRQREDRTFWVPLMRQKLCDPNFQESIDFDAVLANCEAVTDGQANVFGEELLSYYLTAKVILGRRWNVNAWYESMKTCLEVFSWPMWMLSWFDMNICWLWWHFDLVMKGYYNGDFEKYGKQVSKEHYERLEKRMADDQRPCPE
ncbi:P-loop containing protein [Fusarium mundagurra]|uniref:P-loop containing protein n=1 Tax=Fusarium mundagurra TaxID=1567541 RepID=A0A8H5Z5V7_9HYPO|nr:P-loop containing protein [Fusarium mundagurra]